MKIDVLMNVKHLEQRLAYGECYASVSIIYSFSSLCRK